MGQERNILWYSDEPADAWNAASEGAWALEAEELIHLSGASSEVAGQQDYGIGRAHPLIVTATASIIDANARLYHVRAAAVAAQASFSSSSRTKGKKKIYCDSLTQ